MVGKTEVRIDKWLFAVRVFKTRGLAAEACRSGQVRVDGRLAKASRMVHEGELLAVRKGPMTRTLKVLDLTDKRVGPKLAPDFAEDQTPESEWEKLRIARRQGGDHHHKRQGRPSKKERRIIEKFMNPDTAGN